MMKWQIPDTMDYKLVVTFIKDGNTYFTVLTMEH